jgi:hypothetical protein
MGYVCISRLKDTGTASACLAQRSRFINFFAVLRDFAPIASSDDTAIIIPSRCLGINRPVNEFVAAK